MARSSSAGRSPHPAQVVAIVRLVGGHCVAEAGPHRGSRCSGWGHWAKAEVGWVVVEEDAEPTRAAGAHPTTHNGAAKAIGVPCCRSRASNRAGIVEHPREKGSRP
jgi:hypothetical protein